jgi:O-antigen ligase
MAAPLGESRAAHGAEAVPARASEPLLVPAPAPRPASRWAGLSGGLYRAHLVALFGVALSNVLLGLAVLAAPFSGRLRGLGRREARPLLAAVGLYVALLGLSIATSFDPARSVRSLSELFSLCTLLLGLTLVRDERAVRGVLDAILLLATGEALLGLGQLVVAGGPDLAHRIHGTMSHYMTFSGILMIADVVLLARLVAGGRDGGWRRDWRLWALAPINAALVATLTRSAWVGLAAGIFALLLLGRRRLLLWWVPACLLVLLLAPPAVLERAASIVDPGDPTNSDRLCMARAGAAMIRERPLVGPGPDMVEVRYPLYRRPEATRAEVPHLHDAFLEVAAERGLPALAAMLLVLGLPLGRALVAYRREGGREGRRADLWLGIAGAIVAFAVAGLFEDNWGDVEVQRLVLAVLAVGYGLPLGEAAAAAPRAELRPVS